MLEVTSCPQCRSELGLPVEREAEALLVCPDCGAMFMPLANRVRRLQMAEVSPPLPPPPEIFPPRNPPVVARQEPAVESTSDEPEPTSQETLEIPRQKSPTLEQLLAEPFPEPASAQAEPAETEPTHTSPVKPTLRETLSSLQELSSALKGTVEFPAPPTSATRPISTPRETPTESIAPKPIAFEPIAAEPIAAEPKPTLTPLAAALRQQTSVASSHLERDFQFDLAPPASKKSQRGDEGFDPFRKEEHSQSADFPSRIEESPPEDPSEIGRQLSRKLRNAAVLTAVSVVGIGLGFLAWGPARGAASNSAPSMAGVLDNKTSNLLAAADELLSPSETAAPSAHSITTDHAVEPAAFEEPAPTAMASRLRDASHYGLEDLTQSLAGAEEAKKMLQSHSLSEPGQVAPLGRSYARLCYVAQVLTMLEIDSPDSNLFSRRLVARDHFITLFESARARQETRQIAKSWIGWRDRPHGGVFFVGRLPEFIRRGEVFEYPFELAEGVTLPVLLEEVAKAPRVGAELNPEVAVLGVLVENPAERVQGYQGDAPQAVWCRTMLPLIEPRLE